MNILKKLYSPEHIIPESERLGELPSARSAYRDVFKLALPALFEAVMMHLCGAIDTMMVGVAGTKAISAVGISISIITFICTFYYALSIAASAVIARRIGEKNRQQANETYKQALVYSLIISFIICITMFILARPLIELLGTPKSIIDDSVLYIRIRLFGIPVWGLSVVTNYSFRAAGRPQIPMVANIIATLVNTGFNYLLIGGNLGFPALGVRGAALATVICFTVQGGIGLFAALQKNSAIHLDLRTKFRFDRSIYSSLMVVYPAQLVSGIVTFVASAMQTRIVNSLGNDDSFAAYQIITTLYGFSLCFASGFAGISGTLVGQSLGRKRPDISFLFTRLCIVFSMLLSLIFIIYFAIFSEFTIGLFVHDRVAEKATFDAALTMLYILVVSLPISVIQQIYNGSLLGAGDSKFLTFQNFFALIVRTLLFYILCIPLRFGVVGTLLAIIIDDTCRMLMSYIRFRRGKWKQIKL